MSQGVANLVGYTLSTILDVTALANWGWRVGFGFGLLIVPIGFYLRRALPETAPETGSGPKPRSAGASVSAIWAGHRRELVLVVLALYMTTYAQTPSGCHRRQRWSPRSSWG